MCLQDLTEEQIRQVQSIIQEKFDFSCVLAFLPSISEAVQQFGSTIDRNDLNEKGLENKPHVTVLYGITKNSFTEVRRLLEGTGPWTAKIAGLSCFKNSEGEVLKFDIVSEDLDKYNALLRYHLPYESDYPDYKPHVTVAFLKEGAGDKYTKQNHSLIGKTIHINTASFTDPNGNEFSVPLAPMYESKNGDKMRDMLDGDLTDFEPDTQQQEDAPVNNAGGGNIAGIGVGPHGEPGVPLKKRKHLGRRK